jgi:hypothetical protein
LHKLYTAPPCTTTYCTRSPCLGSARGSAAIARVCPTNTNTDWPKTKQSHVIGSHDTGLTNGHHAKLHTTLPIAREATSAASGMCAAEAYVPAPRVDDPHKHEQRLDEDEIKPRHWFTRSGLANGRHSKRCLVVSKKQEKKIAFFKASAMRRVYTHPYPCAPPWRR